MLISCSAVFCSRAKRLCFHCNKVIDGSALKMYGSADVGDKPYRVYMHPSCTNWNHPKILAAKARIAARAGVAHRMTK